MSDDVVLEIVKTTGIIATAVLSTIVAIWTIKNNREVKENRKETQELSIKVDGRLSELLEVSKQNAERTGHAAGVKDQKAEAASLPIKAELNIPELKVTLTPPTIPPPDK